jgi:hypothetical protein
MRFQVLAAVSMKMTGFWDVVPCSLVEVNRRFKGAYCLHNSPDQRATLQKAAIFKETITIYPNLFPCYAATSLAM